MLTHQKWFKTRLNRPETCYIYVIEGNEIPVGQVRFEHRSDCRWEIDFSVSPARRGERLGTHILSMAIKSFRGKHPAAMVYGQVKVDNKPSCRVFESLDFCEDLGAREETKIFALKLGQIE